MLTLSFNTALLGILLSLFPAHSKVGVDSYEVYLNSKLLIRQTLDKPLQLKDLNLTRANAADVLSVRYTQCNAPDKAGKHRVLSLRNENGKIVKEWNFGDASTAYTSMEIPVKELLDVQKSLSTPLILYYSADGRPEGQMLAKL